MFHHKPFIIFQQLASVENIVYHAKLRFLQSLKKDFDVVQFAYEHYVKWELNGGKDLLIGANRLTNRQLFWFALARSISTKRRDYSKTAEGKIYGEVHLAYSNLIMEEEIGFREAFNCSLS